VRLAALGISPFQCETAASTKSKGPWCLRRRGMKPWPAWKRGGPYSFTTPSPCVTRQFRTRHRSRNFVHASTPTPDAAASALDRLPVQQEPGMVWSFSGRESILLAISRKGSAAKLSIDARGNAIRAYRPTTNRASGKRPPSGYFNAASEVFAVFEIISRSQACPTSSSSRPCQTARMISVRDG